MGVISGFKVGNKGGDRAEGSLPIDDTFLFYESINQHLKHLR